MTSGAQGAPYFRRYGRELAGFETGDFVEKMLGGTTVERLPIRSPSKFVKKKRVSVAMALKALKNKPLNNPTYGNALCTRGVAWPVKTQRAPSRHSRGARV